MYSLIVAIIILMFICVLLIGGIIGFMIVKFYPPAPRLHPEMYNPDGSIRPDILYAVTFDQPYDDNDDEEDRYEEA
jgi:hypothetical protein